MESALRSYIMNNIPELNNKIYPTNAPEGSQGPYLVYARINTNKIKTLDGYTNKQALSYMFSVMDNKYSDMVRLRNRVEDLLTLLPQLAAIGKDDYYVENLNTIYVDDLDLYVKNLGVFNIEDIDINNVDEQYEHELGVNRGIIDFTIYY